MTQPALHPATPQDRPALLDLWVEAWTAAMPDIDFEARRLWFSDRLDALQAEGTTTLVNRTADGRLAGFVSLNAATGYLDQLAVRPDQRGSGLADMLVAEAQRLCPDGLSLHVNQDNRRAVRFYARHGFETVSAGTNPRSGLAIWQMRWRPLRDASSTLRSKAKPDRTA